MDSESLPPPGDYKRDLTGRRRKRVVHVALVLLTAWAIVATGALFWMIIVPSVPTRVTVWDSDSWLLVQLDWSTGSAASVLAEYLVNRDANSSEMALNWTVQAWDTVRYGQNYSPGGFPSAAALNLTPQTFGCTYYAILEVRSYLDFVPGAWSAPGEELYASYLTSAARSLSNLTAGLRLFGAGLGTDPLVQLGAARVASIRQNATALFALSQPWGRAILNSDCGT